MHRIVKAAKALAAGAALAAVVACSPIVRSHGYIPAEDELARSEVGRDTRETVAETIGRPGLSGILADGGWYYVKSERSAFLWREPEETSREVVAISFTPSGVVSTVERFGLERGRIVRLSRRVTDSNIEGVGFLRQAFGNIGRIDAQQVLE